MADYYSHNDPKRKTNDQYLDYDTGSNAKWIWAAIVLVAVVALIAIGSSGGNVATDGTPAVVDGQATEMAPATPPAADAPALETAPAAPAAPAD